LRRDHGPSGGSRRDRLLESRALSTIETRGFALSSRPVIAVDLGGTRIRAAVIEPDGTRIARNDRQTPTGEGPAAIVRLCIEAARRARDEAGAELAASIAGVGISSPGPLDPYAGAVIEPPNLGSQFRDVPIAAELSRGLDLPAFLDRDTNVAALGEQAFGAARGVDDAIVGGFFTRPAGEPLGELRTRGILRRSVPFAAPWSGVRACVHVTPSRPPHVAIARRDELPGDPRGDLLQAGPLLVRDGDGAPCVTGDPEGFSAASGQFDSDITAGRYPRAALGLGHRGRLLAVAADGRGPDDAGLTLDELAEALVALGATRAINLDGGGSTTLVYADPDSAARLRVANRPSDKEGERAVGDAIAVVRGCSP